MLVLEGKRGVREVKELSRGGNSTRLARLRRIRKSRESCRNGMTRTNKRITYPKEINWPHKSEILQDENHQVASELAF